MTQDRDREVLKGLLTDAINARLALDDALRAIETYMGGESGELDSFVESVAGTTNGADDEAIDMLLDCKFIPYTEDDE